MADNENEAREIVGFVGQRTDTVVKNVAEALLSAHAEGRKEGMDDATQLVKDAPSIGLTWNTKKDRQVIGICQESLLEAIRSATKREVGE